ncbi:MAG: S8 family serine peptidase [Promethearchaeota archaeon]
MESDFQEENVLLSDNFQENIIVFFNKSTYNNSVILRFNYYGGAVKYQWNNMFSSFSGFSGRIPSELNLTLFKNEFLDSQIEHDEIIQSQMNYASIQTGAINSTWFLEGYKGDTNCSVAILDTGVDPTHNFFPMGYNPSELSGNIVGWSNFINNDPISDDNGHGTYISSIIAGTGNHPYNSTNPITVNVKGNYSHLELFEELSPAKNYSVKIFSFNASIPASLIFVKSSWSLETSGIDDFWVELFHEDTLVGSSHNINMNNNYTINYTLPQNSLGIYDLYVKYHKQLQSNPIFSFNTTINYYSEFYVENYSYFTGIANYTKLASYKILNQSGMGYSSDLISALAHVISNRSKLHIVSACLSIGTIGEDVVAINKAIDEVIENGILVVIAAGNLGVKSSDTLNKIASNRNAIVVGAINDKDQVTSYSSMGKTVGTTIKPDILAPGGSKLAGYRTIISGGGVSDGIVTSHGTSIATAIVSGAINLMVNARWTNWEQWNQLNVTELVKIIKSTLLMTASETNMPREDDPNSIEDESDYSPTISSAPQIDGLKDIHEGYGRLNIDAAIDALTKYFKVNSTISGLLTSSEEDPTGSHVFARKVNLIEDEQYIFNLSTSDPDVNFDIYLFSNNSNHYGEPILLESSRKWYSNSDYFYFTPKENQTNCIITVKAIEGRSQFNLNISVINNQFKPRLQVPEINYFGGSKNTTIMGFQEFSGGNPAKNYSIDRFRFYVQYFDNDTLNVPPQEVYVSIIGISENYTLTKSNLLDDNYRDGALYISDYITFPRFGDYQYFFIASDGRFTTRFPEISEFNITIEFPTDSAQFPSEHSFNDGLGNWTYIGTGWGVLHQNNTYDNRSRIYQDSWNSLYFGTYHNFPQNYTYQPMRITEDPYPNGSLISPLYNLTQINKNITQPFAYFGLRLSMNIGDFIYLQINLNWTGWITLKAYNNEESDWFMETINLTEYIGYFVQFRFESSVDDIFDPINYKGLILDYFSIRNYTNSYSPYIKFNLNDNIPITHESKFHQFVFSCEYYDLDNNYPDFMYLEIDNTNYTMYNLYGDWNASSSGLKDFGILFTRSINLNGMTNQSFRFHTSDGKFSNSTRLYNENNSLFQFNKPPSLEFNIFQDQKYIGYEFSSNDLSDYYVFGSPIPKEFTVWLRGDNTWHPFVRLGEDFIYGGLGQSYGGINQGYGINWDARLITKPIRLRSEYPIYVEYDFEISLQNEFFQPEDQLDKCIVSVSKDYGESWAIIKEYTYESVTLFGAEKIDITQYSGEEIMIMFTLNSNNIVMGIGYGWLLNNIYVGYDKTMDFIAPDIEFISPINETTVKSTILIKANISDNLEIDESRIFLFLNGKSVERAKLDFNSTTNIFNFNWNTNNVNDGKVEVKIVAYDKAGNSAEMIIIVRVNNGRWWKIWSPYIILITSVVIVGVLVFFITEKKGKIWIGKIREIRAEKIRLSDIDKEQIIKKMELIDKEEEIKRPLTLYCKYCRSWFFTEKFDIICPNCEHDQIYAAYNCQNCGKWYYKDEPKENYFCKNKVCKGIRLIRREKDDVQELLSQKGKILRAFEKRRKKFSILDSN